jgi:hypothetical protein
MEDIKYFHSNGISICREDYDSFGCPLCAHEFSDSQMQQLVNNVAKEMMCKYGYSETDIRELMDNYDNSDGEEFNDTYYRALEECALNMGMRYYDEI